MLLSKATNIAFKHAFDTSAHFVKLKQIAENWTHDLSVNACSVWAIGMELIILTCP